MIYFVMVRREKFILTTDNIYLSCGRNPVECRLRKNFSCYSPQARNLRMYLCKTDEEKWLDLMMGIVKVIDANIWRC